MAEISLALGDARVVMASLEPESFDSGVMDPPYNLEFMGKDWDKPRPGDSDIDSRTGKPFLEYYHGGDFQRWTYLWGLQALRVLKPGAYLVVFSGTRTWHRVGCGLEDAGFEIRDTLMWLYGSGFPKSLDTERAIAMATCPLPGRHYAVTTPGPDKLQTGDHVCPVTPESEPWMGWGTALKPSWEPVILLRKPLAVTVAENVQAYGTGGLNIDATRIDAPGGKSDRPGHSGQESPVHVMGPSRMHTEPDGKGRWPANLVLDPEAGALLDAEAGERKAGASVSGKEPSSPGVVTYGTWAGRPAFAGYGDAGGPSRFFYCAKASRSEREWGLEGRESVSGAEAVGRSEGSAGTKSPRAGASRSAGEVRNTHPTVKPVELMRWLVRLVTPPNGKILDAFVGSGSTMMAARLEGFGGLGIDLNPDYLDIARRRIIACRAYYRGGTPPARATPPPGRSATPMYEEDSK